MALCFIEPHDAVVAVADSVGREARRSLLAMAARAWVAEIPERELDAQYAKAVEDLCDADLADLARRASPSRAVANRDFLTRLFLVLGDRRREMLTAAVDLRHDDAFDAGVPDHEVLDAILPRLSRPRLAALASDALGIYVGDRSGTAN